MIYNGVDCWVHYKMDAPASFNDYVEPNLVFEVDEEDSWSGIFPPRDGTYNNVVDGGFLPSSPINLGAQLFQSPSSSISSSMSGLSKSFNFSFSVWYKSDGSAGDRCLFQFSDSTDSIGLKIVSDKAYWSKNDGNSNLFDISLSSISVDISDWHLYTIVQSSGECSLFIDGNKIKTAIPYDINPTSLVVGAGFNKSALGYLSDFRMYKKTLSIAEVKELFSDRVQGDIDGNLYGASIIESDDNLANYVDATIAIGLDSTQSLIQSVVGGKTYSFSNGILRSDGFSTNKIIVDPIPGAVKIKTRAGAQGKGCFLWDMKQVDNDNMLKAGQQYVIVLDVSGSMSESPSVYGIFPSFSAANGIQHLDSRIIAGGDNQDRYLVFTATSEMLGWSEILFAFGWESLSSSSLIDLSLTTLQLYSTAGRTIDFNMIRRLQGTVYTEIGVFSKSLDQGAIYERNGAIVGRKIYEG